MFALTHAQFHAILRIVAIATVLGFLWYGLEPEGSRRSMFAVVVSIVGIGWILKEIVDFPRRSEDQPGTDQASAPSSKGSPEPTPDQGSPKPESILDSPYRADRPVVDGKLADVDFAQKRTERMGEVKILLAAWPLASFVVLLLLYLALGDLDDIGMDLGGAEHLPRMVLSAAVIAIVAFLFLVWRRRKK